MVPGEGCTCAWQMTDPVLEDYPRVPVKLKNNRFTGPLNMVTEMYSLPAYGSLDPNPYMAPFFILFYGIMMADMGYGLLMMAASSYSKRNSPPAATAIYWHCWAYAEFPPLFWAP